MKIVLKDSNETFKKGDFVFLNGKTIERKEISFPIEGDPIYGIGLVVNTTAEEFTIVSKTSYLAIPTHELFQKGQYMDVEKKGTQLVFSKDGAKLEVVEGGDALSEFNYRPKLKSVIRQILGDISIVQIVKWADLHRHSGYSLLDGASKIKDIVANTEYVGAVTDHGVMYGVIDYYKKMTSEGLQPILGFEAYTESIDGKKEMNHLILLAKNRVGFKNLVKLTSQGYYNFYRKPQLSYEMLEQFHEGIIASSACIGGEIPQRLLQNDYAGAKQVAERLISIFGKEDFYIEIQRHGIKEEEKVNPLLLQLAKELGVKAIASADSHYTKKEDAMAHEILLCLQTGTNLQDEKRFRFPGSGYFIHTGEEMEELFSDLPELLDNTLEIAEKCADFSLELGKNYMPRFDVPEPFADEASYFEHLCWKGFDERFKGTDKYENPEYKERLQFEIDTILRMGFPGYFLITWDFVNFAKNNDIQVGPGRGSACGSLVAYVLRITEVDSIEYGLLFERFLNVDRISMPDIDIDFEDLRRDEVIDYVRRKYGESSVSRIITFGTEAARVAVRDVARVMGKPYSFGDRISKVISNKPKTTLRKELEENEALKQLYEDQEHKEVIDMAMKLEGIPRNVSQHACGVIIAPSPVTDFIPQVLIENEETGINEPTTQFSMSECEEMGLLKMDFLGLRTMGVVGRALKDINEKRTEEGISSINFLDIPTDEIEVYDFISKGNTDGVFQLESPGMTSFFRNLYQDIESYLGITDVADRKRIGKQLFERAIAGISLYRPGPIDEIPHYIENMLHPERITYETPQLEPLLNNTYGIIVYQEQVMFIVRTLAGFSKGQADLIRKAMGKKKQDILDEYQSYFIHGSKEHNIKGCIANKINKAVAESIWEKMAKFGLYAFNKSHAGGYAEIAIRTAYLSYHYPNEWMAATLNSFITNSDRIKKYMEVCNRKGISVLPPDVNKSREFFTVDGNAILFGLKGVKNLGKITEKIIEERDQRGQFKDFQDFAERMAVYHKVDKRVLEALVYSGTVDRFAGTRNAKLAMIPLILDSASIEKKNHQVGQLDLLSLEEFQDFKKVETPDIPEMGNQFMLKKEKEFAGFYITDHPVNEYKSFLETQNISLIGELFEETEADAISDVEVEEEAVVTEENINSFVGKVVCVAGVLNEIEMKTSNFYVFQIDDPSGTIRATIFSDFIEDNQSTMVEDRVVIVRGVLGYNDFGYQLNVDKIEDVKELIDFGTPTHPVALYTEELKSIPTISLANLINQREKWNGKSVELVGAITHLKQKYYSQNGQPTKEYYLFQLDDGTEIVSIRVNDKSLFESYQTVLTEGNVIAIRGRMDARDSRYSIDFTCATTIEDFLRTGQLPHPLELYRQELASLNVIDVDLLMNDKDLWLDEKVKVAGVLKRVDERQSKKDGKIFYSFQLEGTSHLIKAVLFNDRVEKNKNRLIAGTVVMIEGKFVSDQYGDQVIVDTIADVAQMVKESTPKHLFFHIQNPNDKKKVRTLVQQHPGELPIFYQVGDVVYSAQGAVAYTSDLYDTLSNSLNVEVGYQEKTRLVLTKRQIDDLSQMIIEGQVIVGENGFQSVQLPDGSATTKKQFVFTARENQTYDFLVMDDEDHQVVTSIHVSELARHLIIPLEKKEQVKEVRGIVQKHQGTTPVFVIFNGRSYKVEETVELTKSLLSEIIKAFGDNVTIR